ncbi:hypothetical protein [Ornithinibacillus contaminans]|uniref:hypothetical protein n=1 Tax=Ornithinibacillus contaminans TaxID=694055 RepID=UPI00064DE353|nr:hypothetical protein [Ornithinibacillus contaminans]
MDSKLKLFMEKHKGALKQPIVKSFLENENNMQLLNKAIRGSVRKMRIYNAKPISPTILSFLTTLRKF